MSETRGIGDRWLAGETLDGVAFAPRQRVVASTGRHAGKPGTVALLMSLLPHPTYMVELDEGGVARLRQSEIRDGAR